MLCTHTHIRASWYRKLLEHKKFNFCSSHMKHLHWSADIIYWKNVSVVTIQLFSSWECFWKLVLPCSIFLQNVPKRRQHFNAYAVYLRLKLMPSKAFSIKLGFRKRTISCKYVLFLLTAPLQNKVKFLLLNMVQKFKGFGDIPVLLLKICF